MKIRIVVVGRDKNEPICAAADEYVARLKHYVPTELIEVREEPLRKGQSVQRVKQQEAERLLKAMGFNKAVKKLEHTVVLDVQGRLLSSEAMAQRMGEYQQFGNTMNFVIGGPSGLSSEFIGMASERWSLSKLTLPHRIARLVLAEQLYRSCTILRGEPYHK